MNQEELELIQRQALQKTMVELSTFNYEAGLIAERKRIIKLLELNAQGDYKQVMLTPRLIAEIKGEA
jgi:hypothetical protein